MKKIIVAVDGHSSCGKSTMAKALAQAVGYTYIDSGAMYRAVTLYCIEQGFFSNGVPDTEKLRAALPNINIVFQQNTATGQTETYLNGRPVERAIRSMEVADKVSPIAALGFVREAMVQQQQRMGREKGIVMDGRDIGTVVFPDAELKIFVTASLEIRARRRWEELIAKGEHPTMDEVRRNLAERDHIDSTRQDGPLKQADDAIVLDNSHLTISEQNQQLLALFAEITHK